VSRYHSHLDAVVKIIRQYKGSEPLSYFVKKIFATNTKYGSKDRKNIMHLCYCYYRLGNACKDLPVEDRIIASLFLCSALPNVLLEHLKPEWNDKAILQIEEKCEMLDTQCSIQNIFPFLGELSDGINAEAFSKSFLIQPDLFLRLRTGSEKSVIRKLQNAGIVFRMISDSCLDLDNSTKLDLVIDLDKEAVVQDYSSQETGNLIKSEISDITSKISVWDCCAGSGGKSIMLYDINPQIQLTVSDKRESILANLKKRFEKAGIRKYEQFVADLSSDKFSISNFQFPIILVDVPCSGSGTWSRTPEQLNFFEKEKINEYAALQKKIISNVIPHLQPGGYFIYITCSVFKKENEEAVAFIKDQFELELLKMELLKGYERKADSMFIAIFKKPS
jgi:16S rRNA (cytosine967-C5)-methyltransferase